VYARPDSASRIVRVIRQLGPDLQFQTLLALGSHRGADGRLWYRLSLRGRPNGQRGWLSAEQIDVRAVRNRIVVHRGARTIDVRRIADGRLLLHAVVAVGRPSAPTPLGRDFYVTESFVPDDPFFGSFALATSAYSSLTEWPGGGVAGIHGTDRPDLLGQAVSHGCVRVSNSTAERLRMLAPPGTPVDVLP